MVKYGFYNAINHDRVYSSTEFGEMFDGLINDGVYSTILNAFAVTPGSGIQVRVDTGRAWFNKTWTVNTSLLPINLADPDLLLPRIDAIVLQIDKRASSRMNSIIAITGTPSSNPAKPALTRSESMSLFQYPLAWVTVKANASSINKSDVENCVGRTPTPFATGMMQQISIDAAFLQWEGQWEEWFDGIKLSLGENAATELLGRIVNLETRATRLEQGTLNENNKATSAQAQGGTDNTHWMTPLRTDEFFDYRNATYTQIDDWPGVTDRWVSPYTLGMAHMADMILLTATSQTTWTVPTKYRNKMALVVLIGAGGGGGGGGGGCNYVNTGSSGYYPIGGGGGGSGAPGGLVIGIIKLGTSYTYRCGTRGTGGTGTSATTSGSSNTRGGNGGNGGDTVFGPFTAYGGGGGQGGQTGSNFFTGFNNEIERDAALKPRSGVGGAMPQYFGFSFSSSNSTANTMIVLQNRYSGFDGGMITPMKYDNNVQGATYFAGGLGTGTYPAPNGYYSYGFGGNGGKGGDPVIPTSSTGYPPTNVLGTNGTNGIAGGNGVIQIAIFRP